MMPRFRVLAPPLHNKCRTAQCCVASKEYMYLLHHAILASSIPRCVSWGVFESHDGLVPFPSHFPFSTAFIWLGGTHT